jgi:hypothetical protein
VYQIVRDLAKLADAPDFTYGPATVLNERVVQRQAVVATA